MSGDALNHLFLSLIPFRLMHQKYVDLVTASRDRARFENFMRVEQWIFDSPHQAGVAFLQFVVWFYQENRLAGNRLEIGKRAHQGPPEASAALGRLFGNNDYTALELDLGQSVATSALEPDAKCRRLSPSGSLSTLESLAHDESKRLHKLFLET